MKGKLLGHEVGGGVTILKLGFYDDVTDILNEFRLGADIEIEIGKPKKKRSLDANNYYHKLCRMVCEKVGVPMSVYHNRNLAEMGIPKRNVNGELIFSFHPESFEWERDLEKHYKPLPGHETEINGQKLYLCCEVKGSSEYNSKEMSILIDNVIADCKEQGIETESKEYIESLIEKWGSEHK